MNRAWKHLAGNILDGADAGQVSLGEIDILLDEYPYFAAIHYLKAAKLNDGDPVALQAAKAKAALYFTNPHWLQVQLEERDHIEESNETLAAVLSSNISEELAHLPISEIQLPEAEVDQEDAESAYDDKRIELPEPQLEELSPTETEQPDTELQIPEEPVLAANFEEEPLPEEPVIAASVVDEPLAENPSFLHEERSDEEAYEQAVWESHTHLPREEFVEKMESEPEPEEVINEPEERTIPGVKEEPVTEPVVDIPFEPLYTIDYFASQGIKYNVDSGKDQLSIKMKSFTEWLKSMKRLHPEKVDKDLDKVEEAHIRENAESSNENQHVFTEAMAEVYLKQGKKEKAVEVYEKLSLLDPSKSAYFALRIKEIKEN